MDKLERFWSKVDRRGPDECWEWLAYRDKDGYGRFYLVGEMEGAHRLSWIFENGEIPEGRCILHRCDNPACVNPSHLALGTQGENMQDMAAKKRSADGVRNGSAKVPNCIARDVVRRYAVERISLQSLADEVTEAGYPVSAQSVHRWVMGKLRKSA